MNYSDYVIETECEVNEIFITVMIFFLEYAILAQLALSIYVVMYYCVYVLY